MHSITQLNEKFLFSLRILMTIKAKHLNLLSLLFHTNSIQIQISYSSAYPKMQSNIL